MPSCIRMVRTPGVRTQTVLRKNCANYESTRDTHYKVGQVFSGPYLAHTCCILSRLAHTWCVLFQTVVQTTGSTPRLALVTASVIYMSGGSLNRGERGNPVCGRNGTATAVPLTCVAAATREVRADDVPQHIAGCSCCGAPCCVCVAGGAFSDPCRT